MSREFRLVVVLAILSVAALIVAIPMFVVPEIPSEREFDNGYSIDGQFLEFYEANGDVNVFGLPMTNPFYENNRQVQYFQNAVMELHNAEGGGYVVRLGALGLRESPQKSKPRRVEEFHPEIEVYVTEDGSEYTVSYDFLEYFLSRGGESFFGPPISVVKRYSHGYLEQYFWNFKLAFDTSDPNAKVEIAPLGELYVVENRQNMDRTAFSSLDATIEEVRGLNVTVSLAYPQCDPIFPQVVYIVVERFDQTPAEGAEVKVWFTDVNGNELPGTRQTLNVNAQGYTQSTILVPEGEQGEFIFVKVEAKYASSAVEQETTFFQIWKTR